MNEGVLFSIDRHVTAEVLVGENQPGRNWIFSLASAFIRFTFIISLITFAIIRARSVNAVLRTDSRRVRAFINIHTSFTVCHEPVAWIAITVTIQVPLMRFDWPKSCEQHNNQVKNENWDHFTVTCFVYSSTGTQINCRPYVLFLVTERNCPQEWIRERFGGCVHAKQILNCTRIQSVPQAVVEPRIPEMLWVTESA